MPFEFHQAVMSIAGLGAVALVLIVVMLGLTFIL